MPPQAILLSEAEDLSTTSVHYPMQQHGFGVGSDRRGAYRRAIRHSRRVRFLRRAIPVVVAAILCAVFLVRLLDPLNVLARLPGSVEGIVISGTRITMASPKLSGYTNDSRHYEMTAHAATQDVTKPNLVQLEGVDAKIDTDAQSSIRVTSQEGNFDRGSGMLTLRRDVRFISSSGYDMRLEEAYINTGTGELVSEKPVKLFTEQGTVRADRFEVENSGEVVRFIGGVVVNLRGGGAEAAAAPAGKP